MVKVVEKGKDYLYRIPDHTLCRRVPRGGCFTMFRAYGGQHDASRRVMSTLLRAGLYHWACVQVVPDALLLRLPNLGQKTLAEIRRVAPYAPELEVSHVEEGLAMGLLGPTSTEELPCPKS